MNSDFKLAMSLHFGFIHLDPNLLQVCFKPTRPINLDHGL